MLHQSKSLGDLGSNAKIENIYMKRGCVSLRTTSLAALRAISRFPAEKEFCHLEANELKGLTARIECFDDNPADFIRRVACEESE